MILNEKLNINITIFDNEYYWSNDDLNGYPHQKLYNSNFVDNFKPYLNGNEIAIQAGGNCGWVPKELIKHFKCVYTFEPNDV